MMLRGSYSYPYTTFAAKLLDSPVVTGIDFLNSLPSKGRLFGCRSELLARFESSLDSSRTVDASEESGRRLAQWRWGESRGTASEKSEGEELHGSFIGCFLSFEMIYEERTVGAVAFNANARRFYKRDGSSKKYVFDG
jgi:hypothetical protein